MNVTSRLTIVAAGVDEPVRMAKEIETLIRTSCADSWIIKSEVLRICAGPDTGVGAFADRSLDDQAFLRRGWKRRPTRAWCCRWPSRRPGLRFHPLRRNA